MYRIGPRTLPEGIKYDSGSAFYTLSKEFVEYLAYNLDTNPLLHGLHRVYNHTLIPDEKFFIVALKNSYFCTKYYNENIRAFNWYKSGKGCHCERKTIDNFCGCSPVSLNIKDVNQVQKHLQSFDKFFLRKFDATIDMGILNFIDKSLYGIEVPNKYWQSIWHKK